MRHSHPLEILCGCLVLLVAAVAGTMAVATPGPHRGLAPSQSTAPSQGLAPRQGPSGSVSAAPSPAAVATSRAEPATSCIACHADPEIFEPDQVDLVHSFATGVHASVGLSCQDCHGGNADPGLAQDAVGAMDDEFAAEPFVGAPERVDQPALCGRCHSDPEYMRRYNPPSRVDEEREYQTSQHGQLLAAGDERVAVCTNCHGVHGIRRIDDPESPVYPTQVATTCAKCHADAEHMAPYSLPDGEPLPVDQFALWSQSVHANALLEREELSAPTCNDCHGNHGAVPPGLDSVNFVCGQCHGREAKLFRGSVKAEFFRNHNGYLAEAGPERCAACHDEPQSQIKNVRSFGECTVCHGNHGVQRPNIALLSPLPTSPCVFCHEGEGAPVAVVKDAPGVAVNYERHRDEFLRIADELGLDREDRFDWMVDQALALPEHTVEATEQGATRRVPRPEFRRLFEKFRIGKTSYSFRDPRTGKEKRVRVVRCEKCHATPDQVGEDAVGLPTATKILGEMRQLTTKTAEAERIMLAARRGGVETRDAAAEIDQAVDARIGLDVLVHGFRIEGAFADKHAEGMKHAETALSGGRRALLALGNRRRGVALVLLVVAFVLVALGLKIREISG